jgi:WD40 repeat protein/DNA-binding SARP family transcriptional activator
MPTRISLAGRINVTVDDSYVDERALPGGQARLVLALLVCERDRPVTREELADNLWPTQRPKTWEAALRGLVARVRRLLATAGLGPGALPQASAGTYRLHLAEDVVVDLEQAAADVERAEQALSAHEPAVACDLAAQARAVLTRSLLPGVESPWADSKRRELSQLLLRALESQAEARLDSGDLQYAAMAAEEAVALDPFRESSHRLLMRAQAAGGNVAEALVAFETCRQTLMEELGVDPSPETQALHMDLLHRQTAPSPTAATGSGAAPAPATLCPYRGLQTFDEQDAACFFGRSADVSRLLERLERTRFLAVLGASGSGKSSLVRAGFLPALRRGALPGSDTWVIHVMRPGAEPVKALAQELSESEPSLDLSALIERLLEDPLALHTTIEAVLAPSSVAARAVVVVDQLEEVFTLCGEESQRVAFLESLVAAATAAHGRTVVVVTMRADLYPWLADHPRLADLASSHQFLVTPLDAVGLAEAIEGPARVAGLTLEDGLTETMLRDVARQPGSLPLLGHCLIELWDHRDGATMDLAAYDEVGGVQGALTKRAEAVFLGLATFEQAVARDVLLRLVHPQEGLGEDVCRRVAFSELIAHPNEDHVVEAVVERLTAARLLTSGGPPAEERWVEVSHEALVRGWARLQRWVREDRAGLLVHRRLTLAAAEWERLGRDAGALYRSAQLAEAAAWAERHPESPNPLERAFLAQSVTAENEQRRRRLRRLRRTATALTVGVVVLAAVGVVALVERDRAGEQERLAQSRQLAAQAVAQAPIDPGRGLTLALEAVETAPTNEAVAALRQALVTPTPRLELPGGRGDLAIDPRSGQLVVAEQSLLTEQGALRFWDPQSGELARAIEEASSSIAASFSPDGRWLTTTHHGAINLWEVDSGSLIHQFSHGSNYPRADWSPDAKRIATAGGDGTVRIWDAATGQLSAIIPIPTPATFVRWVADGDALLVWSAIDPRMHLLDVSTGDHLVDLDHEGTAIDARVSPDGRHAVSVGSDATARIWKLPAGDEIAALEGFSDWVWTGRFSPDGGLVLVGDDDGTIRLAETRDGTTVFEERAHDGTVIDAAFSPDGAVVATASVDGTVMVWGVETGHLQGVLNLNGSVAPDIGRVSVAFTPDGRRLITRASTVEVWDVPLGPDAVISGHDRAVAALDVSPDGRLLATGGRDGTLRLWELPGGELSATMEVHDSHMTAISFSPDGTRLVSANPFQSTASESPFPASIWQVETGDLVQSLTSPQTDGRSCPHVCQTFSAAFSPDGATIVTIGQDGVIRLREAATGETVRTIDASERRLVATAFSPDGELLAAAEVASVSLWHTPNGERALVLDAAGIAVAFDPAGDLLAVAGDDGTATLWEIETGRLVAELRHTATVEAVAWSRDGRFLLTAGSGGARLWDTATHQLIRSFVGPAAAVAFAPDDTMAIGRADGTVHLHRCEVCGSVDELLQATRERRTRELSVPRPRNPNGQPEP